MIYFESPPAVFAFLASIVAIIFWLAGRPRLQGFFRYFPPLIWTYFIPMICSSLGIIPHDSPLYGRFMMRIILPVVIVLLLIPSDIRSIARLGPKAVGMMLIGSIGIVGGAAASFALFLHLLPAGTLPPDLWKGIASLSGSWIGGSPNLASIAKSLELEPTLFGKMVVVDTLCAYTWLGVLIVLIGWQNRLDRFNRADASIVHALAFRLSERQAERSRPISLYDFLTMLAVGFAVSQLCLAVGGRLEDLIVRAESTGGLMARLYLSQVLSGFGWGILLTTFVSVVLSFTRLRKLDDASVSSIGYAGLYLLLTTFGAQADLRLIHPEDLWLLAVGAVWLFVHIAVMLIGARLLRAPFFITATASMANVGGTA
ncbi:MAG: DUF819 family protein, partial [Planctomycetota bacterium]